MKFGLAALLALVLAAPAQAHPLGNFSVNHLDRVRVTDRAVEVEYVLDQAEIPTFRERGLAPAQVLARKRAEVERGLTLRVDGRAVALRLRGPGTIAFPAGQGGLRLTRATFRLAAAATGARTVELDDRTFPGTVGWKAMQALAGTGTAVRTSIPRDDPTAGLRRYPKDLLESPRDVRRGTFAVRPGAGTLDAPGSAPAATTTDRSGDGLAGLFEDAAGGKGVLLLLLLAAFGWGALHALSPGHGKTMVAAYLVGTRGTARDALLLGATVTVTHTIGVFALGFVTLALSAYVLPEQLYPWLQLASGLLVLGVGAAVLRSRARRAHHHHHHHHHHHGRLRLRSLVAMGASAGLLPCPSALVVLLSAIAQHQVGLGLVLIVAFSLGLAATLVALGIAVIHAGRLGGARLGRYATVLPTVSAALIVVVGCVLTANSVLALQL